MDDKICIRVERFFEPCLLYLLSVQESYGYELLQKLNEDCGCRLDTGNLYRTLARFRKEGLIEEKAVSRGLGPDKKVYALTGQGRSCLAEWIAKLTEQQNIINKLIENYERTK